MAAKGAAKAREPAAADNGEFGALQEVVLWQAVESENRKIDGKRGRETHLDIPIPNFRHDNAGAGTETEALGRCGNSTAKPVCDTLHSAGRAIGLGLAQVDANCPTFVAKANRSSEFSPEGNLHPQNSSLLEPWHCHPIIVIPPPNSSNALSSPPLSPFPRFQHDAVLRGSLACP